METQNVTRKPIHPLAWAAGIAVIVFSAVGIGAFMGWIPNSMGNPNDKSVLEATAAKTAPSAAATRRVAPVEHAAPAASHAPAPVVPAVASARCVECGVIESVREIETKGEGTGLGIVGGAVAGGLLGSQVGGGRGKDVMAVVGAVGGGFAGNEVEKRMKATKSYSVTVRFDNGTARSFGEPVLPAWRLGDKVRIVNGAIRSNA